MRNRYKFNQDIPFSSLKEYIGMPIARDTRFNHEKYLLAGILMRVEENGVIVRWMMPLNLNRHEYTFAELMALKWNLTMWEQTYDMLGKIDYRTLTQEEFKRYKTYLLGRSFTKKQVRPNKL